MAFPRLAVRLESFRRPVRPALELAASMGFAGVQFDAVGELSAKELGSTARRQLRHLLRTHDLELVAVGFPTRRGYDDLDRLDGRVAATEQAMGLAYDLGATHVVQQIGAIPDNRDACPQFYDALERLASHGDRVGARLALHTGLDAPETVARFLGELRAYGVAVHYDPAMLLVRGHAAYDGLRTLAESILSVGVQDVVRSAASVSGYREVAFGNGEVDWDRVQGELADIDYQGFLLARREAGEDPVGDLAKLRDYFSASK